MGDVKKLDTKHNKISGFVVTKFEGFPDGMPISCPKIGYNNGVAARRCPSCEYFKGLLSNEDISIAPTLTERMTAAEFRNKFRVLCAYPIARSIGLPIQDLKETE